MKKLIVLIIAIIAMIGMNTANTTKPAEMPVIEATSTIVETVEKEPPESEEPQAEPFMVVTEESETDSAETEPVVTEVKQEPKALTKKPKEQKKESPPAETEKVESGGIVIGDPTPTQTYSCGVAGHHCTGPETHSFICELEQKGCEYCGSHSCPSFYAVDEWGQGCYTPSKCPKYDIHADTVWYCQACGKKCGDGRNGTCVQFVIDCTCPNCGEQVKAWTCHYCG